MFAKVNVMAILHYVIFVTPFYAYLPVIVCLQSAFVLKRLNDRLQFFWHLCELSGPDWSGRTEGLSGEFLFYILCTNNNK